MKFGQPDFEALRKKSDEQFEQQAEERNKLDNLLTEGKVSGIDMAHEEAKIVDILIENELKLFEEDDEILDGMYEDIFPIIIEDCPNLAACSRENLRAMIKNKLNELVTVREERRAVEREREEIKKGRMVKWIIEKGREELQERGDAKTVIIEEFFENEYGYNIGGSLEKGRFSDVLEAVESIAVSKLEDYGIKRTDLMRYIKEKMIPAQIREFLETKNIPILERLLKQKRDSRIFINQALTHHL